VAKQNREARLVYLVAAAALVVACEVDPMAQRTVPKVGMVFTNTGWVEEDVYTVDGGAQEVEKGDRGIDRLDPSFGSPVGGETANLLGWGFQKGVEVYVCDVKLDSVFYANSKKLILTTPAGPLGFCDVAVRWLDGHVEILPSGYLYKSELRVDWVSPSAGPVEGGTPVAVTGAGFLKDTKLLFGSRLALQVEVVDENTIFAITPQGESSGATAIHVSNDLGTASKKKAFTYTASPVLSGASPAAGSVEGGNVVEISGKRLSSVSEVAFGTAAAQVLAASDSSLMVLAPPGEEGLTDVVVSGEWGWAVAEEAYLYIDTSSAGKGIVAIVPDEGPEGGGTVVTVVGCDLVGSGVSSVKFGDVGAELKGEHPESCALVVKAPPGVGEVDVRVSAEGWSFVEAGGYRYVPGMTLASVEPEVGPSGGGTLVRLKGTGFEVGMEVRFGPMPATEVKLVEPGVVEARTPPGSPGLADVVITSGTSTALLKNGFLYTVKEPELWVVSPNYGSRAGGTFVELIGAGFTPDAWAYFGSMPAQKVKVKSYGRVWAYSPASAVGTVDVQVNSAVGKATMHGAFSYFDPTSWYGGTWGSEIDGAVNVTVLDAAVWGPLEGATVVLGADPFTPYKGVTDANGQVTLSGPGLTGPVDVHTSKANHDAASFVHINAENATLYLIPANPPSTGPTDPVEPVPPGGVAGHVVGLGKYVVVPQGDCRNKTPGEDSLCRPCIVDSDCEAGFECLVLGKTGKFCSRGCNADPNDCPAGYECRPFSFSGVGLRCLPTLGRKSARCEVTSTSIYYFSYSNDPFVEVDSQEKFQMESRPGEVAIVCLGGWEDPDTGEFHPLTMGVKRHVNVNSGGESIRSLSCLVRGMLSQMF